MFFAEGHHRCIFHSAVSFSVFLVSIWLCLPLLEYRLLLVLLLSAKGWLPLGLSLIHILINPKQAEIVKYIFAEVLSVSYTHLDVYKRQDYDFFHSGLLPLACGNDYSVKIVPKDINVWISRLFLGDADGFSILYYQDVDSLVSVSYTHLDVYKRQLPITIATLDKISPLTKIINPDW